MDSGAGVRNSAQFISGDIINKAVSFLSSPELAFIIALLKLATALVFGSAAILLCEHIYKQLMRTMQLSEAPNVNFWKVSVQKTIWDLEFSKHFL